MRKISGSTAWRPIRTVTDTTTWWKSAWRGDPDPVTGMVLDLKELKEILKREIVEPYDHRFLNYEVPPFDREVPTTENIARDIWRRLEPRLNDARHKLARGARVRDAGPVRGLFRRAAVFRVTRRYEFAASHRLHSGAVERGRESAAVRQVQQSVRPRPQLRGGSERARAAGRATGRAVDTAVLDELVRREVVQPFDHRNLNAEVAAFASSVVPTSENLGFEICRRLKRNWRRSVSGRVAEAGEDPHRRDPAEHL